MSKFTELSAMTMRLIAERDTLRARVAALEGALGDAATSLETIARDGARKGTMLEDRSQVCGYATSRARVARTALSAPPAPAVSQAAADVPDERSYIASLLPRAYEAAGKAAQRYPQPNYLIAKLAEEAGEVVRGMIHYAEGRMMWLEVEDEIVQLLAMLIRLTTEGDQTVGMASPTQADKRECCIACDEPLKDGDRYYPDADGGSIHADCCGERESYTNADGDPLGPNDPIPEPLVWRDEREG